MESNHGCNALDHVHVHDQCDCMRDCTLIARGTHVLVMVDFFLFSMDQDIK